MPEIASTEPTENPDRDLIFVVDDDPTILFTITHWLKKTGYRVQTFSNGRECLGCLDQSPAVICLDVHLHSGMSGLETLKALSAEIPGVPILMVTGDEQPETVVTTMKEGAYDYIVKPLQEIRFQTRLERAVTHYKLTTQLNQLRGRLREKSAFSGIIGKSDKMLRIFNQIDKVSGAGLSVYIHGESGTGKELIARAIHQTSPQAEGPFVAINCGAMPESMMEDELFGHEKGAFTGAVSMRKGKIEEASNGTLFLDEVAEMPVNLQVKFLRVLQEREIERLGGNNKIKVNTRIVAATNKDIEKEVSEGRFRQDLYYRLVVYRIDLPSLRDRPEDIPLLVSHFIQKYQSQIGNHLKGVTPAAMELLMNHTWPGNIRELENVICQSMLASDGKVIEVASLPRLIQGNPIIRAIDPANYPIATPISGPIKSIEQVEREAIAYALKKLKGNIKQAASALKIGRATLYRKIEKYDIKVPS